MFNLNLDLERKSGKKLFDVSSYTSGHSTGGFDPKGYHWGGISTGYVAGPEFGDLVP